MTQDPIKPLSDIGRRVLRTVRYLATPPAPGQGLEPYESQLRDPLMALSGLCDELLRLAATDAAAEPEKVPDVPVSRFVATPNPGSAFPTFSRAATLTRTAADRPNERSESPREYQSREYPATPNPGSAFPTFSRAATPTRTAADRPNERPESPREYQSREYPATPRQSLDGVSPFEQYPRSIEDPVPDEPGSRGVWEEAIREPGGAPQTDRPEASLRPAIEGRVPGARDMRNSAGLNGEPSPEESSATRSPVRQDWPEFRRTEVSSDTRTSEILRRAENGQARGAGEADVPLHGSRLTGSTEHLAALLRSHVAQPESAIKSVEKGSQEGEDVFPSRQGDDERGAYWIMGQRTRPDDRVSIEEIMEMVADELETEFVRTYGSSGR
jgi:hypothetical protein